MGVATELTFKREKETKNTIRYAEEPVDGQAPIIGTIYVAKWWIGNPSPPEVKVTVEK